MNDKIKITPWDTSEFLETDEDINMYLEVSFETGDPKQMLSALKNVAKARGMVEIDDDVNPSLINITNVIDSLGYRLSVMPKAHIEEQLA